MVLSVISICSFDASAISKKLVEMMKGHIWVKSEIDQGSTFTFALPTAPGNVEEQAADAT